MLGYRHKFNMGIVHLFYISRKPFGKCYIIKRVTVVKTVPRADMHFINIDRGTIYIFITKVFPILIISPNMFFVFVYFRRIFRSGFKMSCKRIAF